MRAITSAFFFHPFAPTARRTDPVDRDVLRQQLPTPPGYRANVQAEQLGDARVTSAAGLEGFEPGIQTALLLVEQAEEQHDGRAELVGQDGRLGQRADNPGLGQPCAPRQQLLASAPRVCCTV